MFLSVWKSCCDPIPQRWVLGVMGLVANVLAYCMRICLSLAITQMVIPEHSSESSSSDETCPSSNTTSAANSEPGTYDWDDSLQGIILSAFYWGYVISHVPGGLLAEKYGGKYVFGFGVFSTAIFTLLTPVVVEWGGSTPLIVLRFLMGLGEGVMNPGLSFLLSQWVPPSERSKIGTLVFAGNQLGTAVANSVSGILLEYSSLGWRSVFYVFGSISIVWFLIYVVICYSSPERHPFISDKESKYIADATHELKHRKVPLTPWRFILTSMPVWTLVIGQIGYDWGVFTMATDLPLYMNNVLKFSIKSSGLLIALPYLSMWIVSILASGVADWLINTGKLSTTNVRKLFTTIGAIGPAIFIIAASYAGCNRVMVVAFFIIGMSLMGCYYPGLKVNILDVSPNYSGTVMGIVSGLGALSGIITPYLVGVLTPNQTLNEWRIVFWIVFAVFISTNLVYLIYASGEVQPWNDPDFLTRQAEERRRKAAGEAKEGSPADK